MSSWEKGIARGVEAQARKRESPDRRLGKRQTCWKTGYTHKGIAQISDYIEDKGARLYTIKKSNTNVGRKKIRTNLACWIVIREQCELMVFNTYRHPI